MTAKSTNNLVFDACVLIDLVDQDRELLALVVSMVGSITVPRPVLAQVATLDEADAVRLGLRIYEPSEAQFQEAAALRSSLSFEDWLCLIVARDEGMICVTSDGGLERQCAAARLEHWDALRPLRHLVAAGAVELDRCRAIVREMADRNRYIRPQVVREFDRQARRAAQRLGRTRG